MRRGGKRDENRNVVIVCSCFFFDAASQELQSAVQSHEHWERHACVACLCLSVCVCVCVKTFLLSWLCFLRSTYTERSPSFNYLDLLSRREEGEKSSTLINPTNVTNVARLCVFAS